MTRFLAALLLAASISPASSHDFWINKGKYKGAGGVHCCGEKDCPVIDKSDITVTPQGYVLKTYNNELVPFEQATPSEIEADGEMRFYRCHDPYGGRRCFFAPVGGS